MRFPLLSGTGGAQLLIQGQSEGATSQLDVVAIDNEVALAVECKSSEKPSRRGNFVEELGRLAMHKQAFLNAVQKQCPLGYKRQGVMAMFLSNAILTDNDKSHAKEAKVILFDERDLEYYETLVSHLGEAAKYQLFSDMMPGKEVPGLHLRVPAIRFKMGGTSCYSFTASPDYLLKICYHSRPIEDELRCFSFVLRRNFDGFLKS